MPINNSIAAYFAAIEIHNKPKFPYRYETVSLLLMNAWELVLKAYIKKYIKNKSIFKEENHTISLDKALVYVNEKINSEKHNKFTSIKESIEIIEEYRNKNVHFYSEEIGPYIFMLIAKCTLNYVNFIKEYFNKDIISDDGFFILPLGFKLPFKPEDFLSNKVVNGLFYSETKDFVKQIISTTDSLKRENIEDSIVLGFNIYLESIKKNSNSDLIAAITTQDGVDITIAQKKKFILSNNPNAQKITLSDDEIWEIYPNSHKDLTDWCIDNIEGFKQSKLFNSIKKEMKKDDRYSHTRYLDNKNKSSAKTIYSNDALSYIKKRYEELNKS